jgi:citrate synthase
MKCFPETGHPMDALQASAAALGLFYSKRALDNPAYIREAVVRLLAKIPTMVAAFQLMRKGNDPVRPTMTWITLLTFCICSTSGNPIL